MEEVYAVNYTMKETEENTNKWKDIPGSWTGRSNVVKIVHITKSNL